MRKYFFFLFVIALGLLSCEESDPIIPADLIDSNFDSPSNYELSATIEIFPFRANGVRFFRRPDLKYKIEAGDSQGQSMGIVFENLAVGKYTIGDDNSLQLSFTNSDKVRFNSNASTVPSNMELTITGIDSTGTIVSGAFKVKVYDVNTNSPGDPSNQRNIFTGVFRNLELQ